MKTHNSVVGIVLVLVSALSFGAMAIFARMAYADGVTPTSLLLLRFAIAATTMLALTAVRREWLPRGRSFVGFALIFAGAVLLLSPAAVDAPRAA